MSRDCQNTILYLPPLSRLLRTLFNIFVAVEHYLHFHQYFPQSPSSLGDRKVYFSSSVLYLEVFIAQ